MNVDQHMLNMKTMVSPSRNDNKDRMAQVDSY